MAQQFSRPGCLERPAVGHVIQGTISNHAVFKFYENRDLRDTIITSMKFEINNIQGFRIHLHRKPLIFASSFTLGYATVAACHHARIMDVYEKAIALES